MAGTYQLSSSQTALALVLPKELCVDIDDFRSKHDKAFNKWPAHINILYPFVPIHELESALETLQQSLSHDFRGPLGVSCDGLNVFKHNKSATLFLQPDHASTERLRTLRKLLTSALGCKYTDGTRDGEFRPHLTLGQSDTHEHAVAALTNKASSLQGLQWIGFHLTALKRDGPGRSMSAVKTLSFGQTPVSRTISTSLMADWKLCFEHNQQTGWSTTSNTMEKTEGLEGILVSSINIMEDPTAPPFPDRLPTIVRALDRLQFAAPNITRVLCLQEVSPKTLPLILDHPTICKLYPFSSHGKTSLLPSIRNQVILSSKPFIQFQLQFAERHKNVLIAQLCDSKLSVANVHLSSGFSSEMIEIKRRQVSKLSAFLERRRIVRHTILAGDFNIPTSSLTLQAAIDSKLVTANDVYKAQTAVITTGWQDAFSVTAMYNDEHDDAIPAGEQGATYDKLNNTLAALHNTSLDRRPQRYDRILARSDGSLQAQKYFMARLCTSDGRFASDHYGISAVYAYDGTISETDGRISTLLSRPIAPTTSMHSVSDRVQVIYDDTDIHSLIKAELPSENDITRRKAALEALNNILKHDAPADLILDPIGSYAMGTWLSSSDIDILASGKTTSAPFFQQALGRLREQGFSAYFIDAKVQRLEVEILGVHFDIQYRKRDSARIQDVKAHNTQQDTDYVIQTIPSLESFKVAQRFIMVLLKRRGLCGAKFGYLGGIHITLMLNRLLKLANTANVLSPASIIRTFFSHYAAFDWSQPITDPNLAQEYTVKVVGQPSIYIRSLFTPATRLNVAESCSVFAVHQFAEEFSKVNKALTEGRWRDCLRPVNDSISNFLNKADCFIQVQLDFWSLPTTSAELVRGIVGSVESRLLHVPTKLAIEFTNEIDVQIWPARFRSSELIEQSRGYHLIGITGRQLDGEEDRVSLNMKKLEQVASSLSTVIQRYKPWAPDVSGVQCSVMTKRKVLERGLVLDERDLTQLALASTQPITQPADKVQSSIASKKVVDGNLLEPKLATSATSPLRPVQDIIARLNHDTDSYDINDFLVGYDDRFAGTMEIPLSAWKRDATHEEFIPLHRIVWIRRRDDLDGGEKVWDRHTRLDKIFGSGRQQT